MIEHNLFHQEHRVLQTFYRYLALMLWVCVVLGVGFFLGRLTQLSISTWYVHLTLSPLTPPNAVFGMVWSVLYFMIACAGWLLWQAELGEALKRIRVLYLIQLALNWSWTPLFFYWHRVGWSLLCIVLLCIVLVDLIVQAWSDHKGAAFLLMPYMVWVMFATYLTGYIFWYN